MQAVHTRRPVRIGVTGGIGSGKSTVGHMLAAMGAVLIDADQISREATGPHGVAMGAIRSTFGDAFVDACGAMDRTRMRDLAFNRPDARAQLEAIVHPLVAQRSQLLTQEAIAAGARIIVHDIPLLAESGRWARQLDAVLVIDCSTETQIERVVQRSQLAPNVILGIIATQTSRSARRAIADAVITNDTDCTLGMLQHQVHQAARLFGL